MENLKSLFKIGNVSSLFIISIPRRYVLGWHQHWCWHYWVKFCLLWATSTVFSPEFLRGQELLICLCPPMPVWEGYTSTFPGTATQMVTWGEGRDRHSSTVAPWGASVREHSIQNITEERTRWEVGKYRGRALKGLMNYSNHKTVLSPYTHTEIVHSKLVWEEVFTGPVLRVSNH